MHCSTTGAQSPKLAKHSNSLAIYKARMLDFFIFVILPSETLLQFIIQHKKYVLKHNRISEFLYCCVSAKIFIEHFRSEEV